MTSLLSTVGRRRAQSLRADGEIHFSLEERLAEDLPVFGLGRAAARRGPLLQRTDELALTFRTVS
jgi:hypothetical protein